MLTGIILTVYFLVQINKTYSYSYASYCKVMPNDIIMRETTVLQSHLQPLNIGSHVASSHVINFRNFTEIIGKILLGISDLGFQPRFQLRFQHLRSRFHPCCGPLDKET